VSDTTDQIQRLGGTVIRDGLADRLVVALDPSPATRALVARRIVEFAEQLDAETLDGVVLAAENTPPLSTADLAARAGVTPRQIRLWTAAGYLHGKDAPGSGNPHEFGVDVIPTARIMGSLVHLFRMSPSVAYDVAQGILRDGRAAIGSFTVTRDGRVQ
jgi:hypothetical protein